jgi:nucleoside-diphosphate-sugar epimerase
MRILMTGAAGYLGRGMVKPFLGQHEMRLMDVVDSDTPAPKLVGSVADLDDEVFHVSGVPGSEASMDAAYTSRRLNWTPKCDFSDWPSKAEWQASTQGTHAETGTRK